MDRDRRRTVLHVAHGIHRGTGGAAQAILRLAQESAAGGYRSILVALDLGEEPIVAPPGVELRLYSPSGPARLGYSRSLARDLPSLIEHADLVHSHFLWSDPMWSAWKWARRLKTPLMLQTHGGLLPAALRRSRFVKRISYTCCERPALRAAHAVVATSEHEAACLRALNVGAGIRVIPLGLDVPTDLPPHESARRAVLSELQAPADVRYILYLGRIDEHKQLDVPIRMLAQLPAELGTVSLLLVGPVSPPLKRKLTASAEQLGVGRRLYWRDAVYGADKWKYFCGAELFALPSRSENFGFVAVESLAAGTPVLASRGTPWSVLNELGLGDWIEAEPAEFSAAATRLLRTPDGHFGELRRRCRAYAVEQYSWSETRRRLLTVYSSIVESCPRPVH